MDEHQKLVEQVEHLLRRAEFVQDELRSTCDTLRQQLASLRQEEAARPSLPPPAPRNVAPTPPPVPQAPAAPTGIISKLTKRMRRANLTSDPTPTPTTGDASPSAASVV